jgi:hypothetical protein
MTSHDFRRYPQNSNYPPYIINPNSNNDTWLSLHLCEVSAAPKQQALEMAPKQQAQEMAPKQHAQEMAPEQQAETATPPSSTAQQAAIPSKVASYHLPQQGTSRFRSLRLKALHPCAAHGQADSTSLALPPTKTRFRAGQQRCFHNRSTGSASATPKYTG